jgi:antitoxin component of MazEF toxin-antitoxin module
LARIRIDDDGAVRLPDSVLGALGVSPGRVFEAKVEKGRLVLTPLPREDDPFAAPVAKPDESAFEKALRKDLEDKARAADAFERGLREKADIDVEKEREERDRWR